MPSGVYERSEETMKKIRENLCNKKRLKGRDHPAWKGGISNNREYILIYKPDHPFRNKMGYVLEHRLIMEKRIGRYINPWEDVHHINGDKSDNRIENLQLIDHREHVLLHWKYKKEVIKVRT